jgi:very-short-patch-repair endonuclease
MTRVTEAHARRLAGAAERANAPRKRTHGPTPRPKPTAALRESAGEAALAAALRLHGKDLPAPERELRFHPERRWRFDFAWPAYGVATEVDGGQWKAGGGRHNTDADRDKLNQAALHGWRIVRLSPQQIAADPAGCVDLIRRCLCPR